MKFIYIIVIVLFVIVMSVGVQIMFVFGVDRVIQYLVIVVFQSDGEVCKIDKEQGKLILCYGFLENFFMLVMIMVFKVVDLKMFDVFKEGDKVKFFVDRLNGVLIVMVI